MARLDEVQKASETGSASLVDARTAEEYANGHIPKAVNIPFLDNAVPNSGGAWKSLADLRTRTLQTVNTGPIHQGIKFVFGHSGFFEPFPNRLKDFVERTSHR